MGKPILPVKASVQPNDCFLGLYINHRFCSSLVDTGAVASCISERMAQILKLKPEPTTDEVKLVSANNSAIESKGVVHIELSIQGLVVPFTMHVLRSLSHHVIRGSDLLRFSGAVVNYAQRSISLFDGLVMTVIDNS